MSRLWFRSRHNVSRSRIRVEASAAANGRTPKVIEALEARRLVSTALTGQVLGSLRNNFTGWVGFEFTVGANPLTVSQLGRWDVAGNAATHTLKLADAATGADLSGGSVSVNTSGAAA